VVVSRKHASHSESNAEFFMRKPISVTLNTYPVVLAVLITLLSLSVGCRDIITPASAEPSKKTGLYGLKGPKSKTGLYGLKGPKNKDDPELAKRLAENAAKNANIHGLLVKRGAPPACRKPRKEDIEKKEENLKKVKHEGWLERGRALDSLRFLLGQDTEVKDAFLRVLKSDPAWYCRELVVNELVCLFKQEEVSKALVQALKKDKLCLIRSALPGIFTRVNSEEIVSKIAIVPMLEALKNDTCAEVRAKVIIALGEIWARWTTARSEKILNPIIKALNDSHVGVRCEAAETLIRMKKTGKNLPTLSKVKNLEAVEKESCSEVRKWVLKEWLYRRAVNDKDVRKVIEDHKAEIRWCYKNNKDDSTKKRGEVRVRIVFSSTGQVVFTKLVGTTVDNSKVEQCIVKAARRWVFPKPKEKAIQEGLKHIMFEYPFKVGEGS